MTDWLNALFGATFVANVVSVIYCWWRTSQADSKALRADLKYARAVVAEHQADEKAARAEKAVELLVYEISRVETAYYELATGRSDRRTVQQSIKETRH